MRHLHASLEPPNQRFTNQQGRPNPPGFCSPKPRPRTPAPHTRRRTPAATTPRAALPPPQPRCRVRIRGTPPSPTSIIPHSKAAALAAAFLTLEAGDPDLDPLQNPSIVPRPELTCSNPLTSKPPWHPHDPLLPPFPFRPNTRFPGPPSSNPPNRIQLMPVRPFPFRPNTPFPGTPFPQAPHPEYTARHDAKSAQPPP